MACREEHLEKLLKLAKKKSCRSLNQWIKAIANHFWWCCASCEGDPENLKEKWLDILYHITDCHRWKGLKTFKKCQHKKLTKKKRSCKAFLKQLSPAYKALESVVTDKSLLGALKFLTKFNYTEALEVYHFIISIFLKGCISVYEEWSQEQNNLCWISIVVLELGKLKLNQTNFVLSSSTQK